MNKRGSKKLLLNPSLSFNFDSVTLKLLCTINDTNKTFSVGAGDLIQLLSLMPKKFDEDDFIELARSYSLNTKGAKKVLGDLKSSGIVIPDNAFSQKVKKRNRRWKAFGWEAALHYFTYITDYPFLDYGSKEAAVVDENLMLEYKNKNCPPAVYKDYKNAKKILLPKRNNAYTEVPIIDVISDFQQKEKKQRRFNTTNIGDYLFFLLGEMGSVKYPTQGKFILRTSPSGGARHPIEGYIFIRKNANNSFHGYHYSVRSHALEEITKVEKVGKSLEQAIYDIGCINFKPNLIVVFTGVFARSMWRYRESRSYRVILHDLGHLIETANILAKSNNWNFYTSNGFDDSSLEKILKLKPEKESALAFIALGT